MRLRTVRWRWDRVPLSLWEVMFAYRALSSVARVDGVGDVWRVHW